MKREPEAVRFRRKVRRRRDGHAIWTGGVQFRMADGRRLSPSAAAYEIANGPRTSAGCAFRTCPVSGCVAHVGIFTQQSAPRFPLSKITADQVLRIRTMALRHDREVVPALAAQLGIAPHTIYQLRTRRSRAWRGVGR